MIFEVHVIYSPYRSLLNKKPKYKIHVTDRWICRLMDKQIDAQLLLSLLSSQKWMFSPTINAVKTVYIHLQRLHSMNQGSY